jgi:hypothetical protein
MSARDPGNRLTPAVAEANIGIVFIAAPLNRRKPNEGGYSGEKIETTEENDQARKDGSPT